MSFKPMHDLESLTDAQREQHYLDACQHFGLPPELRLLEFIWLDASDGKRNLVLYAKKGATDMIRDRQKISVISTVAANGPGYAAFIVEGKDLNGRHEFAVGSAALTGSTGQGLANAVMTSHTRAVRRLTLQFVGGGLLDESEVQGPFTDINRATGSLSSLATLPAPAQPVSQPNTAPGADITPTGGLSGTSSLSSALTTIQASYETAPKPLMVAPAPFSGGSVIPEKLVQIEPAPKRKPGRKKSEISLDRPVSTVIEETPKSEPVAESVLVPSPMGIAMNQMVDKVSQIPASSDAIPGVPTVMELAEKLVDTPTKEQTAAWKAKLSPYTTQGGVLNQGGMTENIFGKIRMFTMKQFPNAVVLPNKAIMLTNFQWATLIALFEKTTAELGPAGLVKEIEAAAKQ